MYIYIYTYIVACAAENCKKSTCVFLVVLMFLENAPRRVLPNIRACVALYDYLRNLFGSSINKPKGKTTSMSAGVVFGSAAGGFLICALLSSFWSGTPEVAEDSSLGAVAPWSRSTTFGSSSCPPCLEEEPPIIIRQRLELDSNVVTLGFVIRFVFFLAGYGAERCFGRRGREVTRIRAKVIDGATLARIEDRGSV